MHNLKGDRLPSRYETDSLLCQYLLFHYGSREEQLPYAFGPQNSLDFPVRCVTECIDLDSLSSEALGIDLGCAVGRSTFELARYCKRVLGIDNSQCFIEAAKILQVERSLKFQVPEEGVHSSYHTIHLPSDLDPFKVDFECQDVMELQNKEYDIVLAANLICRLPNPVLFLETIHQRVSRNGQLILTSPYSWLEEFSPSHYWLHGESGLEGLKDILNKKFELIKVKELPFLIREHKRKYQWGVAQATTWRKILS